MDEKVFSDNVITQVGIVVKDIEKAAEAFAAAFGMEKPGWSWTDGYEKARTEYRGRPSEARAKLSFMKFGSVEIELIEPDEKMSTWREHLETRGEGIHHLAFVIKDMGGHIERAGAAGMNLVQRGEYEGGRYAYIDAVPDLKMVVELLEND